ncbi:MAG: serine hydrolase domain-containing protein [Pseudomonadota bacterium]
MNFSSVEKLLLEGAGGGVFPGGCAGVLANDGTEWIRPVGTIRLDDEKKPVTQETLFDFASLTKVLGTTGIVAVMAAKKELSLDDRVVEVLSDLPWHADWSDVTIRDLLAHRAGFAAWCDLAREYRGTGSVLVPGSPEVRGRILSRIASMPAFRSPRSAVIYSDLGFILLGALLEKISGNPLRRLIDERLRRPLDLETPLADPIPLGIPSSRIAATEDLPWRGGVIQGVVHDDNAYVLGGLAGHAGLFGTVGDCLAIGKIWRDSVAIGTSFLSKKVAAEFVAPLSAGEGSSRALGWDLPSPTGSQAGERVSERAVGHLGYTGTSIWIDLLRGAVVVLLTNRVHPTSKNEKIKEFRPLFHDAVWEALDS